MEHYIGYPIEQSDHWQLQTLPNNCAVVAQQSIINQYLDPDDRISEAEAVYQAMSHGWLTAGGTSPEHAGALLDVYGIPHHQVDGASVEQLAYELSQGHRVIVGVRSEELWDQGPLGDFYNWVIDVFGLDKAEFNPANHAVSVTGIDMSDPNNPQVVINDPGDPNGAGKLYPLDQFMDAWQNSDFHYIATNEAPPDFKEGSYADLDWSSILGPMAAASVLAMQMAGVPIPIDPVSAFAIGSGVGGFIEGDGLTQETWDAILANI